MNDGLDALATKRQRWVDANRENVFEEGIKRLLTELYPDNAHFIYELLQNAEDTRASVARFTLSEKLLHFEHNGQRVFSLSDVNSITSIGVSTKRDDPTCIGKFGVGFKAVFAYTNTPVIRSGGYHFRIRDLVVPEAVGRHSTGTKETVFTFPFDHHQKNVRRAGQEVSECLKALGENTLLFLRSIRKIEYLMPDGALGSQERIEHGDGHIEIRLTNPSGTEMLSHWLRFQKNVKVIDDDGKTKDCCIAIAYRLEADIGGKTKKSAWKIVPLDRGQVSIFFPAEKETSNLRFHLHAPFASTVARDSVRDCEANHELLDHIATLVVESLFAIRDKELLDIAFLAALPNSKDNLPPFYQPIHKAVVKAFQVNALTPTKSGAYQCAKGLYRGPAAVQEVIDDDDLSLLTGFETPLWAKNPPQENQRSANFLSDLSMEDWGWSHLVGRLDDCNWDEDERSRIEKWIKAKDDTWLFRFNALLGEAHEEHGESLSASDLRFVRVASSDGDDHVTAENAYFQADEGMTVEQANFAFVKPSTYSSGRSESRKRYAKSFLESAGVRAFDERALIERTLGCYKGGQSVPIRTHINHIREFVRYWKQRPFDVALFRQGAFLAHSVNNNHVEKTYQASVLYLDLPFEETGLIETCSIHAKRPVWSGYQKELGASTSKDFCLFLKAIGVMYALKVERVSTCDNPQARMLREDYRRYGVRWTDSAIDTDYTIDDLIQYLLAKSVAASRLVWNAVIEASSGAAEASFRPNQKYETRYAESQLIALLKQHAWIPDKQGNFSKPQDSSRDELRDDFPYDDRNGLLTAIDFGEEARKRSLDYQKKNEIARLLGYDDAEHMELVRKATKGKSKEELARMAQEQASIDREEFPDKPSADPERRRQKLVERRENAPEKATVQRERSIEPGLAVIKAEAKAYLRANYTNANGKLICQCCHDPMPFKLPKTELDYFEAVQFIKGIAQQFYENYLALCPTCSAKYQHACLTDHEEIKNRLMAVDPDGQTPAEIEVMLADKHATLRFVGAHALDLKVVLK